MKLETYIKGSGEPLLLLGGVATNTNYYKPLLDLFATKYRVHFFNYPGFGGSDKFKKGHNLKAYLDTIDWFVKKHKLKYFHLTGISLGGYLAIKYANNHLDNINSLILFTPMVKLRSKSVAKNIRKVIKSQNAANKLEGKRYVQSLYHKRMLLRSKEKIKQGKFAVSLHPILKKDLPDIPTLVFLGKRDHLVDNGYARKLFVRDNIKVIELSPGGHMAHTVDSERVLKKMAEFTRLLV